MTYDKELRNARRAFAACVLGNLAVALINGWHRNWMVMLASIIWALNCFMIWRHTKSMQITRDETRVVQASIHALLESQKP